MMSIDHKLRNLVPAIRAILTRYPEEQNAAPELRKLAIKHSQRRYKVFAAYRLLQQQRDANIQETPK